MTDWLTATLLGIVEGITEFIPVSSTGHLLIAEKWLPRQSDLFNVVIQCGAVAAVLPLFWPRLRQFIFQWREPAVQQMIFKVFAAFVLTCVGGFILEKKHVKLPEQLTPVAIALLVGGILFLLVEFWLRGKQSRAEITWTIALAVGFAQLLAAVFPGTSRSGATILISLVLGLSRPVATEFSFLVGIPTMFAAGTLKIYKAFHHPVVPVHENWTNLIIATVVAAIVSFIAVKWLLQYVKSHTFTGFGWYRIALGILILALWV